MIQEEAKATPNIVAGTLQLNCLPMYVLFDYGATHSFVTNKLVGKLGKNPCRAKKGFTISTTLGTNININHVFKGIRIDIKGYEMRVYLIPFELHDFDVILGMEWLCMMIDL
jgi:hypothetical protein